MDKRVYGLVALVTLCGILLIVASNFLFYDVLPWTDPFDFLDMALLAVPFAAVVGAILSHRVAPLAAALRRGPAATDPELVTAARRIALDLPLQAVVTFLIGAVGVDVVFHAIQIIHGLLDREPRIWDTLWANVTFEYSLATLLSLVLFTALRRQMRDALLRLPAGVGRGGGRFSLRSRLLLATGGSALWTSFNFMYVFFVPQVGGRMLGPFALVGMTVYCLAASLYFVSSVAQDAAADVQGVADRLRALSDHPLTALRSRVPVTSADEVGDLSAAFNAVQTRMGDLYEGVRRDLEASAAVHRAISGWVPDEVAGGLRLACWGRAAAAVGGDLVSVLDLGDERVGIAVGDATGHGVAAALAAVATLATLRSGPAPVRSPAAELMRLNRCLHGFLPVFQNVTLLYAIWDGRGRRLVAASAGHPAPLRLGAGAIGYVEIPPGPPLGVESAPQWLDTVIDLRPGEGLLLYSDGVTWARAPDGRTLGDGGFEHWVARAVQGRAEAVRSGAEPLAFAAVVAALTEAREGDLDDDVSVLCLWRPLVEDAHVSVWGEAACTVPVGR